MVLEAGGLGWNQTTASFFNSNGRGLGTARDEKCVWLYVNTSGQIPDTVNTTTTKMLVVHLLI